MLKIRVYKNNNKKSPIFGKYLGRVKINETYNLEALAEHMSMHNTPYSKGTIYGVLKDMVSCIHELVLQGNAVKLNDLAIFSLGIKSGHTDKPEEFDLSKDITSYKLRARATGQFSPSELANIATAKQDDEYTKPKSTTTTTPNP
ncbi:MAG: DNA-binding protein [Prevotella sp.]|nr:DNA-binding protein [Prevotella sp.]